MSSLPITPATPIPDVAALDSPIMLREGFGQWTHEDAAYVYAFHRAKQDRMFYARQRNRLDPLTNDHE